MTAGTQTMIEIIAIDNQTAQADLLRLAASFFESRLFSPKQQKQLHMVVEVSASMPPRPISREQLAKKPGLFKSAKYQFDCAVNVAQGFEMALSQFTHELVHASQIINSRYEIMLKPTKTDGVKQKLYHAKWMGKKCGVIDDMIWESRPWESESVIASQQLSAEFFALIHGQQSHFPAQGKKKDLKFLAMQLSMPPIPQAAPAPVAAPPLAQPPAEMPAQMPAMNSAPDPMAPPSEMANQEMANQEIAVADMAMPDMPVDPLMGAESADKPAMDDDELAALITAPEASSFGEIAPPPEMPSSDDLDLIAELSDSGDGLPSQPQPDMTAPDMMAPDMTAMSDIMGQPDMTAPDIMGQPDMTAPNMAAMPAPPDEVMVDREVYVQGIDAPRSLKHAALQAKKQELAAKGLLK